MKVPALLKGGVVDEADRTGPTVQEPVLFCRRGKPVFEAAKHAQAYHNFSKTPILKDPSE